MKPGRELDALVAEHVMGLEPWPEQLPSWKCKAFKAKHVPHGQKAKPCIPPEYSTNIAAAWKVIEKIKTSESWLAIWQTIDTGKWYIELQLDDGTKIGWANDCDTAPQAICLAALKYKGIVLAIEKTLREVGEAYLKQQEEK